MFGRRGRDRSDRTNDSDQRPENQAGSKWMYANLRAHSDLAPRANA